MSTKYSVSILRNDEWESIALFDSRVSDEAMITFAYTAFENGNSIEMFADNIRIVNLDTGECIFDWQDSADEEEYFHFYGEDDVDESNYDPYLGCDVYETEPFCDMW